MTRHAVSACGTLLLAGIPLGCAKAPDAPPPATPVKIEVARSASVDDTTEYVAALKSRKSAVLMPQVEGQVTAIFVRSGDRVTLGTPLVQIDPAKQQATVRSQEDSRAAKRANLEYAKQQYERLTGLHASGIVSKQDLDQAKSALDAAEAETQALDAQVHQEQVELHYYSVTAPMTGIVGDIPVRVGDRVTVSTMLTTVDEPGSLEVYVSVPAERAPLLRAGMPVQVLDGAGEVLASTRIAFIASQVEGATQTVLVKAPVENAKGTLRTAQSIRARIVWGTHDGPLVPVLAVSRMSGQYFAFVAEEGKGSLVARQRPLRVGEITGNDYVVLEGIQVGDKVIVSGTQFLADGAPVKPQI